MVQKMFRTAMQALEETLAILDQNAFGRAADYLARALQRHLYGLGGSAQIARVVSHKFLRSSIRSSVFDHAHRMTMSAAQQSSADVAMAFSHFDTTSAMLDAAEMARRNGAQVIAVTNFPESPLARVADVVLCSTAQHSPVLGKNATARVAHLNLLAALFVTVAESNRTVANLTLSRTMRAVQPKRRL